MGLEALVVCVDNSDWMRNGDYVPTRMDAQEDAAFLYCSAKTDYNPETMVSVMTGASKRPQVLVTLTNDQGKIMNALHGIRMEGAYDVISSVQVAQLVLKHRQNKNQKPRIVMFIGSPVKDEQPQLVKTGKKLRKNNIAVDVVNFGEVKDNTDKLQAFVDSVNNKDNPSHLLTVLPGKSILSDVILTSPIMTGDSGSGSSAPAASGSSGGGGGGEPFLGVDPNMDPDLYMALKASLEEEKARQQMASNAEKKADEKKTEEAPKTPASTEKPADENSPLMSEPKRTKTDDSVSAATGNDDLTEEELLAQALELSMATSQPATSQQPQPPVSQPAATGNDDMDEELRLALEMSMAASNAGGETKTGDKPQEDIAVFSDPNFVGSVLNSLPGVDMNDDTIQDVLKQLQQKDGDKKDDKK